MSQKRIWTDEQQQEIIRLYTKEGLTMAEIAKRYATKHTQISSILHAHKIPIKKVRHKNRLLKEDYFSEIDTEQKAYFLGLMLTDGAVVKDNKGERQDTISLELVETDVEIINKFKEEINSNSSLYFNKRKNREKGTYTLSFRSNQMSNDLSKYGIVQNKTYITEHLPQIPEEFMVPFIRGIIDGDGSLYFSGNCWHCSITSYSENILNELQSEISQRIGKTNTLKIYNAGKVGTHRLTYNHYDTLKIVEVFYRNNNISIARKNAIANRILEEDKRVEDIV